MSDVPVPELRHLFYCLVILLCLIACVLQLLLRTTKLAQSASQYYFVLQTLHKVRPSTTVLILL